MNKPHGLLINYDQGDLIGWFPQALAAIAANPNFVWKILDYNVLKNFTSDRLTRFLNLYHFDIVGISACAGYWQHDRCKEIAIAVNVANSRKEFWFIAGGPMFTASPEYFLDEFGLDSIIKGDGERLPEPPYKEIENLGTDRLENYGMPAYSYFDIFHYRLMRMPHIGKDEYCLPILTSRGCTNECSFCYRHDQHIRLRPIKDIVKEIRYLQTKYNISYFALADELALASPRRAMELAEAFMPLKIKWDANARLDTINKEILTVLKKSGCMFLNFGVESYNDEILEKMSKNLTTEQIEAGIQDTLAAGITPGINIIFGFPGETEEHLEKSLTFLMKYDDGTQLRTIRPVTPYPGSPLYYEAIEKDLLRDAADFYCKHKNSDLLTVNMSGLSNEAFYIYLNDANQHMIRRYFAMQQNNYTVQCHKLYSQQDISFRGWRQK